MALCFYASSCTKLSSASVNERSAIATDEQAAESEKQKPMDFSSPPVADPDIALPGLPEDLVWFTSRPGAFGSPRAKQGGVLKTYLPYFPQTFRSAGPMSDGPFRSALPDNVACVEINMETKEWMPAAATHWAFGKDKHSVYFLLSEGMLWSDGFPVSAEDYLFMQAMMRSENIRDSRRNDYYGKNKFELKKISDRVIRVWLADLLSPDELLFRASVKPRPAHFFKDGVIPADYVKSHDWKAEPVTGPYFIDRFTRGESLLLRRVRPWWGSVHDYNANRYNVDAVDIRVIAGGMAAAMPYFYKALVDALPLASPAEMAGAPRDVPLTKSYVELHSGAYVPRLGFQGIFLNTEFPLFSSKAVRAGLSYACDIQMMIDSAVPGGYMRYRNTGIGHVFAGVDFDADNLGAPDFDAGKAAAFFEAAGYTNINQNGIRENGRGEALAFELLYGRPGHTEQLTVLRERARLTGVDITLNLMAEGAFTALRDRKYQAYWGSLSTGELPDYDVVRVFSGWSSPSFDSLNARYKAERNIAEKAEISRRLQTMLLDAALVIPGYYSPYSLAASWKWVRYPVWLTLKYQEDFTDPLTGGYFWLDENIRDEVLAALASGKAL